MGEKETATGEARYSGAQFASGGMSSLRTAGGESAEDAQAAKGVAQVGLGVAGQRSVTPGGTNDPSPADAARHEHVYQHNETDLQ